MKTRFTRLAAGLGVLAVTVAAGVTLAAPAQAQETCPEGHFCLFTKTDGKVNKGAFKSGSLNLTVATKKVPRLDKPYLAINNTTKVVELFAGPKLKEPAVRTIPAKTGGGTPVREDLTGVFGSVRVGDWRRNSPPPVQPPPPVETSGQKPFAGPALPQNVPDPNKKQPVNGDAAKTWPCGASNFCVYEKPDGQGAHVEISSDLSSLDEKPEKINDKVMSIKNITGKVWCVYAEKDYKALVGKIEKDEVVNLPTTWHGKISGFSIETTDRNGKAICRTG